MKFCRKCNKEIFSGDICDACEREKRDERTHRQAMENSASAQAKAAKAASEAQERAADAAEYEVEERRERTEERQKKKQDRLLRESQLAAVESILNGADQDPEMISAVAPDANAQLDLLARLANKYPYEWEAWLFASTFIPHRVEVAYARLRAAVVPFLEIAMQKRNEFLTSPDQILQTLTTTFLFKDFEVMRQVERDLPKQLKSLNDQSNEILQSIQELESEKSKCSSELWNVEADLMSKFLMSLKGRTQTVIESEISDLEEEISKQREKIARLQAKGTRVKRAFELSRADPTTRVILKQLNSQKNTSDEDEQLLTEHTITAAPNTNDPPTTHIVVDHIG